MELNEKELGLPWYKPASNVNSDDIYGTGGNLILSVGMYESNAGDRDDVRDFTVQAANSHHPLLRALLNLHAAARDLSTRHEDHIAAMNEAARVLREIAAEGTVQP